MDSSFSMDLKGQMLLGVWTKFFSLGDAIAVPHFYKKNRTSNMCYLQAVRFLVGLGRWCDDFPGYVPVVDIRR